MRSAVFKMVGLWLVVSVGWAAAAWGQSDSGMTAASSPLRVENAVVCQKVVDRAPMGTSDVFAKEIGMVYAFCRVLGASGETHVIFNWYYKGSLISSVTLPVRSASWRTWSSKTISPEMTGEWMVEILAEDGKPLESIIFFIQ